MKVSELYGKKGPCQGRDVYIVGTGPTLRVFPVDFLKDKCCILLNNAHRIVPELGPIAFSNHQAFLLKDECQLPFQIVKARLKYEQDRSPLATDNHVSWKSPDYYCFSYREPIIDWKGTNIQTGDTWSHHDEQALWKEPDFYWNERKGSVSIFACQFALLAGAKSISLIGCDCCEFEGTNGDGRPERLKCASRKARGPVDMKHNYDAYARGLMRMVHEARKKFGVPIFNLSPFPGFGREQEQFRELQDWSDNGWR